MRVLLFSEQGCEGESILLTRSSDLCEVSYPSGVPAKDNVASLRLAGADRLAVDVYGTCRLQERPAEPMLMETVFVGCTDLKFPLQGSVDVRLGGRTPLPFAPGEQDDGPRPGEPAPDEEADEL